MHLTFECRVFHTGQRSSICKRGDVVVLGEPIHSWRGTATANFECNYLLCEIRADVCRTSLWRLNEMIYMNCS
jgi:hypothetical protein